MGASILPSLRSRLPVRSLIPRMGAIVRQPPKCEVPAVTNLHCNKRNLFHGCGWEEQIRRLMSIRLRSCLGINVVGRDYLLVLLLTLSVACGGGNSGAAPEGGTSLQDASTAATVAITVDGTTYDLDSIMLTSVPLGMRTGLTVKAMSAGPAVRTLALHFSITDDQVPSSVLCGTNGFSLDFTDASGQYAIEGSAGPCTVTVTSLPRAGSGQLAGTFSATVVNLDSPVTKKLSGQFNVTFSGNGP